MAAETTLEAETNQLAAEIKWRQKTTLEIETKWRQKTTLAAV